MSAMKRRDVLKLIAVGGALPFVGSKEVEPAQEAQASSVLQDGAGNVIYNLPDTYADNSEYWEIGIEPSHEFYEEWREFKASLLGGGK